MHNGSGSFPTITVGLFLEHRFWCLDPPSLVGSTATVSNLSPRKHLLKPAAWKLHILRLCFVFEWSITYAYFNYQKLTAVVCCQKIAITHQNFALNNQHWSANMEYCHSLITLDHILQGKNCRLKQGNSPSPSLFSRHLLNRLLSFHESVNVLSSKIQ